MDAQMAASASPPYYSLPQDTAASPPYYSLPQDTAASSLYSTQSQHPTASSSYSTQPQYTYSAGSSGHASEKEEKESDEEGDHDNYENQVAEDSAMLIQQEYEEEQSTQRLDVLGLDDGTEGTQLSEGDREQICRVLLNVSSLPDIHQTTASVITEQSKSLLDAQQRE